VTTEIHKKQVNILMNLVNIVSLLIKQNRVEYKCNKHINVLEGVYMKKATMKLWGMVLVIVMMVSIAGCAKDTPTAPATEEKKVETKTEATTEATTEEKKEEAVVVEEKEPIEIEFWNISVSGDDVVNAAVQNAIKTIESERPYIKINMSGAEGDAYKTKIRTAVSANEMPDIFYTWLPGYSQGFVDSGSLLKMDDYLSQDAKDNMNMSAIQSGNGTYGGIYALPVEVKMGVLYCNEKLFSDNNIKMPDTYEELLEAVAAFEAIGMRGIIAPGVRSWPIMMLYNILAIKTVGAEAATLALKKETSFDQPGFLEAANKLKELVDANAFVDGAIGLDNPEANAEFVNGNIPMYFMGSWAVPSFANPDSPVSEHLVAKPFPGLGNAFENHILGGAGDGYVVSNNSMHKEDAVWVVERFTKLLGEGQTVLFPVWNIEKDFSQMAPVYGQLQEIYNTGEGFVGFWDTFLEGDDAQTHKNLVLELFAGVKTPEEFIAGMIDISNK
jgi:raffinose/stachyose/melibiose transport system substrate-binding protein